MKKSIICINAAPKAYAIRRFGEESSNLGLDFVNLFIKDISISLSKGKILIKNQEEILDRKNCYVIPRNVRRESRFQDIKLFLTILEHLKEKGIRILNGDCLLDFPNLEDKLVQYSILAKNNFPIIPTQFFNSPFKAIEEIKDEDLPLIIKPRWGSKGDGIDLLTTLEDLRYEHLYRFSDDILLQKYIPNSFDLRIIATKDSIVGAMKRSRTEGIVNNYSAGGNIENYVLKNKSIEKVCKKLCSTLHADYLGIDIVTDENTGEFYILEVNRFCQFQGFEEATQINLAKVLIDMLTSSPNKR